MKAIGIILAGGQNKRLEDLTVTRVASALPIASSYRAIDFVLSNMTNSGISKVAVMTQYNSRSLNDHLASSKWWNFGRKKSGLFVLTPSYTNDNSLWFRGTSDSIYQNLSFLERSNDEYVVIANGDGIYKMDYNDIIKYHKEKEADVTIACRNMEGSKEDLTDYGVLSLDENCQVTSLSEKPLYPQTNTISIAIYVLKREKLIELVKLAHGEGRHDFVNDILIRRSRDLKIYGYKYDSNTKGNLNYWKSINTVSNYFNANMDFLNREVRSYFTKDTSAVLTKPKDEPPVKYNYGAYVKNCTVGNGSIISGAAENSVLFRKITIGENSDVKNSIVLEGCKIGVGCAINYAILDKNVIVEDGAKITGEANNPIIIRKGSIINA